MTLTLPAELQDFVEDKVAAGAYSSEEEVIREAVERMKGNDDEYARNCVRIREAVEVGWQQARAGQLLNAEDVWSRLEERKGQWRAGHAGHE
jgi:putative addiction module CopG family antidote